MIGKDYKQCPTCGSRAEIFDREDPSEQTLWMCENKHMFIGPGNPKRVWE